MPVAGGGYFRLLPHQVIERGLRSITSDGRPAVVYCHPYEFNRDELDEYPDVSDRLRYTQGIGRRSFATRLGRLLSTFAFGRLSDVLTAWGIR